MEAIFGGLKQRVSSAFSQVNKLILPGREMNEPRVVVASLTVVDSDHLQYIGREFPVYSLPTYLGRASKNDIILPDLSVSRTHARISILKDQAHFQDLGSRFGTYINEIKLGSEPEKLTFGDQIRLGYKAILEFSPATPELLSDEKEIDFSLEEGLDEQITMTRELNPEE
jgi:pSer/pThr/pTyr-binding forkhead associated (FHA) protein